MLRPPQEHQQPLAAWNWRGERREPNFVSFGYTEDATAEIGRFLRKEHRVIVPFTVRDILDGQIAQRLA